MDFKNRGKCPKNKSKNYWIYSFTREEIMIFNKHYNVFIMYNIYKCKTQFPIPRIKGKQDLK